MKPHITVSVIIPTFTRQDSLRRLLNTLELQTLSPDLFEVIVVDDGSTDSTQDVTDRKYRFALKYLRQENQGATKARNKGALQSQGDILVFIDDDIALSQQTLTALVEECVQNNQSIILGVLVTRSDDLNSLFAHITSLSSDQEISEDCNNLAHFTECKTGLLAVRRKDFLDLGMFQDPTGGWPNWDDVDFGYRAHLEGFRFLLCGRAIGDHWDYSMADRTVACQRWYRASKSAARLFQTHPGLQPHIPMYHDKIPVVWKQDSFFLITRKLARHFLSLHFTNLVLEQSAGYLEQHYPSPSLLRILYRWIVGGYLFRGYRDGLQKLDSSTN